MMVRVEGHSYRKKTVFMTTHYIRDMTRSDINRMRLKTPRNTPEDMEKFEGKIGPN